MITHIINSISFYTMRQLNIAVFTEDVPILIKELQIALPKINFHAILEPSDIKLKEAEIVIATYPLVAPHLKYLSKLKWLQGTFAGLDSLMPYIDKEPPFLITRFSGQYFGRLMSDYVIAYIVNNERDLFAVYENQKMHQWVQSGKIINHRMISELTIGILGYGTIGKWIGKSLHMLGAKILGYGRRPLCSESNDILSKYFSKTSLPELLAKSDYVVNVLPNTPETKGLLNGNILEHCKEKKTVFINIGRGTIIDEEVLINALNNDWISGAVLDVFNEEPLPKTSPLWTMKQVKITPHIAGVTQAKHVAETFKENLQLYLENKPIPATVNFSNGY